MTETGGAPAVTLALGRCDEMRAEVFLRGGPAGDSAVPTIEGTLVGPIRGRDTTLPVTARLEATATTGLSRTILTEPAYWTPDLPNRYRLEVAATFPGGRRERIDRLVGLRRLGVRGRSLWLDGHRWVPRAVRVEDVAGIDACKPAALAALVTEPDEAMLDRADGIGVAILATIPGNDADATALADRIGAWSGHPSVALAILPQGMPVADVAAITAAVEGRRDTLLLAATVAGATPPHTGIPTGVDALVVALATGADPHDDWRAGAGLPLIAWRRHPAAPAAGRRPCDELQAALAAWATAGARDSLPWDWAGYAVG